VDVDYSSQIFSFWGLGIIGLGVLGFMLLSLLRIHLALAVALAILYNPFFVYYLLLLNSWVGGRMRAATSTGLLLLLAAALFMRRTVNGQSLHRVRTPMDRWVAVLGIFLFSGMMVGFYADNDLRLMIADLFPFVEFCSFFFITTLIIREPEAARKLMLRALTAGTATTLTLVVLYFLRGYMFQSQWIVPRLMDFIPVILLPCTIGMYLHAPTKRIKILLFVFSLILLLAILVGFSRSLWIATIVSTAFVLWSTKERAVLLLRHVALVGGSLLLVLLLGEMGFFSVGSSDSFTEIVHMRTDIALGVREMGGRQSEAREED